MLLGRRGDGLVICATWSNYLILIPNPTEPAKGSNPRPAPAESLQLQSRDEDIFVGLVL